MWLFRIGLWMAFVGQIMVHDVNFTNSSVSSEELTRINLQRNDFSANITKNKVNDEVDLSKIVRLKDILNVFSIELIASKWKMIRSEFAEGCSKDIEAYFRGLREADVWAVKINFKVSAHWLHKFNRQTNEERQEIFNCNEELDDSSGHYTSGFFYGNNYWMGSKSLCESIYHENSDVVLWNTTSSASDLPFAKVHQQTYYSVQNENPPFVPGFFIVKMLLNESFPTTVSRIIYVGLCLPSSCSTRDVNKLTELGQHDIINRHVQLLDIRVPTEKRFDLLKDGTFRILTIVSSIVLLLMILGTLYEVFLTDQLKKTRQQDREMMNNSEASSGIGCASSEYSDSITNASLKKNSLKELNIVLNLHHASDSNHSYDEHLEGPLNEPKRLSIYSELLLSFSVITNFNAICDRSVGSDTIPSIHGLRAFSMAWVILGHTCIVVFKYSDNMEMRKDVEKNFFFQAITNGAFSVDTFFFISGFLISYLYFRTNAKGKLNKLTKDGNEFTTGVAHFLGLVAYRFMRLTTPYMFVLGVVQVSMKYLATYSIFDPPTLDHITCPKYWWRNVLYINTLFPVEEMCMLWSWYLANDTQFYILGAIILIIGARHFKPAACTTAIFLVLSWITTAVIAFTNNHRPNTDDPLALFDKIYDKPWTRLGPYLIGMAVGWILFRSSCKIKFARQTVITAWIIAILNLFVLVFGLYHSELSRFTAAAYSSLSHSAWALSLAWITIACSTGYGGYINSLLSAPCLYPFSRVTYCAYLVHPIVIRSMALNSNAPTHLGGDTMVVTFFGLVVSSYLLSFLVSLSFEAPVVTMLKILSPGRKKRIT